MSDLKGKVHEVIPAQKVSEKLKKQELIIEYAENEKYPEYLKFEAINDKCDLIAPLKVGDGVEVFFNYKGRAWTDKTGKKSYFNSLQLWKVTILNSLQQSGPVHTPNISQKEEDDLPF